MTSTIDRRWVVFDSNVYVASLREGIGGDAFADLEALAPRTFLAAVVVAELRRGARDEPARRLVDQLVRRFERVRRIVVPTAASWYGVGDVLAKLIRREPAMRAKVRGLWNDALIAMSARQIGATVVTGNVDDFTLLRRYVRFEMRESPGPRRAP